MPTATGRWKENGAGGPTFNQDTIRRHVVAGHITVGLQRLAAKKAAPATPIAAAYDGMQLFFDDPAYTVRDRSAIKECLSAVLDPDCPAIPIGTTNSAFWQPRSFSKTASNPSLCLRQRQSRGSDGSARAWSCCYGVKFCYSSVLLLLRLDAGSFSSSLSGRVLL